MKSFTASITGDDESTRRSAQVFATASNRALVALDQENAPHAAAQHASSVTVVVSSAFLSKRGTDWIRERLAVLFRPQIPFGILTAEDGRMLSDFVERVLKRAPVRRAVAEVDYASDTRPYGINEDGTSFVPELRTMPAIALGRSPKTAEDKSKRVLFFRGHSREYCGQRGRLCSRSVASDDDKLTCVGGLECVAVEFARSPTRDVRSDIVFLDICSGGKFPGSLERSRNLTTQLIEGGANAVFTSAGRYYVDELTPLLAMRLMASGLFNLGSIAQVINTFQRQRYGTVDCVLLFGDPEAMPFSDPTPLPEILRTSVITNEEDQTLSIELKEPIASNVEVFLLRDEAAALVAEAPYTLYRQSTPDQQAILLRLDDNRHAALIVIGGHGTTGELVFGRRPPVDLTVFSAATELVSRITLLPTATPEHDPLLAANTAALGALLSQTRASVQAAVRLGSKSITETAQLAVHEKAVRDASVALATQHARACTKAITWSGWLESYYVDCGQMDMLRETILSGDCPVCKAMPLLACRYRAFGIGRVDDRERLECEHCGVVCDVIVGTPPIWIEAPTEAYLGTTFEARVHGRNPNPAANELPLYLGVDAIVAYIDPAKCEIKVKDSPTLVPPGKDFTISLDCRVDPEVRAHAFDLRAILSLNGSLALANRRILYRRSSSRSH